MLITYPKLSRVASKDKLKADLPHSEKVTGISQMYDADVPEITIQQRSGNRSFDCLRKCSGSRASELTFLAFQAWILGGASTSRGENEDYKTHLLAKTR